jgi:hypothetical protein
MVTHIVFFSFKDEDKQEHMEELARRIRAMYGRIETLRSIEVGFDFSHEDRAMDMALVASFDDRKGLEVYATHPVHLTVIEYARELTEYTRVVDYENQG